MNKKDDIISFPGFPSSETKPAASIAGIPSGVKYKPGQEPQNIRKRLDTLFEKLDTAYPDKVIVSLHKDHKKWGETTTELYRVLGYPDGNAFLNAYGYKVAVSSAKGGRPAGDHMEIINELKKRYPNGSGFSSIGDLAKANPDIAPKFKNLQNQADNFFGMTFTSYLVQEGVLSDETRHRKSLGFDELQKRYSEAPFTGTLAEFREKNSDISWSNVEQTMLKSDPGTTLMHFLINQGIMVKSNQSKQRIIDASKQDEIIERKLEATIRTLKERYPSGQIRPSTITQLCEENPDIKLYNMSKRIKEVYDMDMLEYLVRQGILDNRSVLKRIQEKEKKEMLPVIAEEFKAKRSEMFEIDGIPFRVVYQPKAGLNRLYDWTEKFLTGKAQAATMELATELHRYDSSDEMLKYVSPEEAIKKYGDFMKVCALYTSREMMEEALKSAPKKKDGTLAVKRIQHLAFTGLAVHFEFYELCAVNETDNVMTLEIRNTTCSHKYLPAYNAAKTCEEMLAEHGQN